MNFRETLGRHLLAIETRDLDTLAATLADNLVLIMADGKLKRTKGDCMEAHRAWFAMQGWTLTAKPVEIYEGGSPGSPCCTSTTAKAASRARASSPSSSSARATHGSWCKTETPR